MKASILAIGTELTTGQIINKNASTLSKKLNDLGIKTCTHITIPDDRELIFQSLNQLKQQSDLIFVTGGLGPTSDDFTREVITQWLKQDLIFNEDAWTHIVNRLSSRGFPVRDMQKQQCYFPEKAIILNNEEGTAHAFRVSELKPEQNSLMHLIALPGPPREIECVWQQHLKNWLIDLTEDINKPITLAWDTIGVGESEIAHKVESVLKLFPELTAKLEMGYRVHLPYVEVKMTHLTSDKEKFVALVNQVDKILSDFTITRNFTDVAHDLCQLISSIDFTFYDFVSEGYLHSRLSSELKLLKSWSFKQDRNQELSADFFSQEENFLALIPQDEFHCLILASVNTGQPTNFNIQLQKIIEAPMKSSLMSERRKQYFSEMSLVELFKSLNSAGVRKYDN